MGQLLARVLQIENEPLPEGQRHAVKAEDVAVTVDGHDFQPGSAPGTSARAKGNVFEDLQHRVKCSDPVEALRILRLFAGASS